MGSTNIQIKVRGLPPYSLIENYIKLGVLKMNNFNGIGRLTKDADLKYTPNGVAVAKFTLAIKRNYKNDAGEYESDFINFVAWKRTAEAIANYTQKGLQLAVSGRLQSRTYDDTNGGKRFVVEVIVDTVTFIEKKKQPQPQ